MRDRDQVTPIDVLHDDVLLAIFDFCVANDEWWQSLVHVCRRWRSLVFQSPRRLNLRLFCTHRTPAREGLDVWPALPLVIRDDNHLKSVDNIVVALEQSDRVCQIELCWVDHGLQWDKILAAMQVPFPELTGLGLSSHDRTLSVIPNLFLGGSAPRLQYVKLDGIPFPGLPNLLLSSDHLVCLFLYRIPHSGYISPEAMAALLSILSSLRILLLEFGYPRSRPDSESRGLPPPKRSILPSLDQFHFQGTTEYLEALVTRIDTPQLHRMDIYFSDVGFETPRLAQFINTTPTLREFDEAHVQLESSTSSVKLQYRASESSIHGLRIQFPCRELDLQLSSIEQVCKFLPLSMVEDLYIVYLQVIQKNTAIENNLWLPLFSPFTAVKNLHLLAPGIAAALQELVGSRIEVLPSLENISVDDLMRL